MTRRIVSANLHSAGLANGPGMDGYFDRVLKYIPADVVGAWVAITGIIPASAEGRNPSATLWIAFAFGIAFTALWTWRQTATSGQPVAVTQVAVATVAFVVWVFALGGPFATMPWYAPFQGSLALIGYTLVVGLIVPKE